MLRKVNKRERLYVYCSQRWEYKLITLGRYSIPFHLHASVVLCTFLLSYFRDGEMPLSYARRKFFLLYPLFNFTIYFWFLLKWLYLDNYIFGNSKLCDVKTYFRNFIYNPFRLWIIDCFRLCSKRSEIFIWKFYG